MEGNVVTGMENVVTSLTTELSSANLWGVIGSIVPFLAISVLFALGVGLVFSIIRKIKKHK